MPPPRELPPSVHEAFFTAAARDPSRPAVEFAGAAWSYGRLAEAAKAFAALLAERGVAREEVVLLRVRRSPEACAALLGILAHGAAYLPVDPSTQGARWARVARLAGVRFAFLDPADADGAAQVQAEGIAVLGCSVPTSRPTERPIAASEHALAYVLTTSGSTGEPKGVCVEHASLSLHADGMARHFALTARDRVLQFASWSFDVAAEELFPTWSAGACVVLREESATESFAAFDRFLRERSIHVVNLPAGFWQEWSADMARRAIDLPPSLRLVIAGSERASVAALAEWKSRFGKRVRWINGYGPTEATITASTFEPGERALDATWPSVPIGRALPWVRLYVLDSEGRRLAAGETGELAIGGDCLARGYLGATAADEARFQPDPFSEVPGARLYRSGDRARELPDGSILFVGRDDEQVKLRGYRIELGEIEARLAALPGVETAAVLLREDMPGGRALVAYVSGDAPLPVADLRARLAAVLPDYMVPAIVVKLDRLPRLASGKIDRRALPRPASAAGGDAGEAPRAGLESELAKLWCELLGLERVGRELDFFRAGGHSLLAMQLCGRILEAGLGSVTPRVVFEHPTPARLAAEIQAQGAHSTSAWPPYPPMERVARGRDIPLSSSQEPVWFLLQLEPDLLAYNTQFSVRFDGPLDMDRLDRALNALVARHEALRTTFHGDGPTPCQRVREPWRVTVERVDLSSLPETAREARAEELCSQWCARRFDVGTLPLIEWHLLRRSPTDHELVQVEHHFIHDGWSIAILLRDLSLLYEREAKPELGPLAAPEFQFADYVDWQRRMLSGERRERLIAFWRKHLADAPPLLNLPTDRPRPPVTTFSGASEVLRIPSERFRALADFARREGFTPFHLLLAAFELVLARHSSQQDIVIATAAANRRTPQTEGILGMLVNPVPIRVDTSGDPSLREFVARVRRSALDSFEHQDLPFEQIVQAVEPRRDFAYNPIFQVLFSFHDSPVPELEFGSARVRMVYRYNHSAKFDMNLVVIPRSEQRLGRGDPRLEETIIEWEYNTDLFDRARVLTMMEHLSRVLDAFETGFDRPCSGVAMLTDAEMQRFAQGNETAVAGDVDSGLFERFARAAGAAPDAIAVRFAGRGTSYGELSRHATQVATELRRRGVQRGDVVALCVERSPAMIAALLGIGAAGAAYLPLDPALPIERRRYVLDDAFQASPRRFVLTEPGSDGALIVDTPDSIDLARCLRESPSADIHALPAARGADLAYVIYTSGSTGRPKGVEVEHRQLANFLNAMASRLSIGAGDRWAAVTTLSFDIAALELFLPLTQGACVVLASHAQAGDPHALQRLLEEEGASVMQATPATWRLLIESGWSGRSTLTALCGGEALALDLARELRARVARAYNVYGPTETTVWSTIQELPEAPRRVCLGRPLDNTRLHVLSAARERLPAGAIGELWIAGSGVARGYRGRADLTAERFMPELQDAATGVPASGCARMYATGDLVRWNADGELEYMGRVDEQVKLRGFRIELGEIESTLRAHPGIADAAAALREFGPGDQRLVAWYVERDGESPTREALLGLLAARLPEYMLPARLERIDALPRTHNGKLDRKRLPAALRTDAEGAIVAPRGEVETAIAAIWAEVLGVERVGAKQRFFDLGGHSLLAVRAIQRMELRLGVRVPPRDLMLSDLSQVARAVEERRAARGDRTSAAPANEVAARETRGGGLLKGLRGLFGAGPGRAE